MKKIEAIIRSEKLEPVRIALEKLGYPGMTITEVRGHGRQKGLVQLWRGREYKMEFLPKLKIEIVASDRDAAEIAEAIMAHARTGEIGDGKIFISPIEQIMRVRTGDKGEKAL